MAKAVNILTGLFQSITPATPTQEILLSIKNPTNKMNFMTMTMLYKEWENLQKRHPEITAQPRVNLQISLA